MEIIETDTILCKNIVTYNIEDFLPKFDSLIDLKAVGLDIISIERVARLIERYDFNTLSILFTHSEICYCQNSEYPNKYYSICFAVKEAVGKALGTGLVSIDWNEIETKTIHNKQLVIDLYGKANIQAEKYGIKNWIVNWLYLDKHILVHVLAQ
ncbi:holo-acyl-carrier-protein synthase [Calothrix parasitica NIES-267]|uniref:Holo-acyl-carrier-protein synthase n=1 Tax=Calothrix parasitica NIES-267 TaxID=1973488 RepID=A0A1Z4LT21_9CYAN|nr:holo-acyl-carrier-protein synthase [Calothrix parasitica NIES-267]